MFDAQSFVSSAVDPLSTQFEVVPEGEWQMMIDSDPKQLVDTTDDDKAPVGIKHHKGTSERTGKEYDFYDWTLMCIVTDQRVKDKLKNQNLMQAPLYMMAATALQARPAGMFYLGVKAGIEYAGWSETPLMDSLGLPENWLENARSNTFRIIGEMRRGRIDVLPADPGSCGFCDARDICRVESAAALIQVEGV